MNGKPLTASAIAANNLKRRPFRSICLIFLVSLFAFTLFGGTIFAKSLENGMESLSKRLGADILTVPYGYEADIQSALLRGEPSTFYFDAQIAGRIAGVEGVGRVSPQLYIATLQAGCCSYPLQLIGFEPETDFIIQPWLSGTLAHPLADGEILIGSSINAEAGQKLKFFDRIFLVAARLEKTGMGFDTSVFMNLSTAKKLAKESERIRSHPVAEDDNLISSVMVRIKNGYDVKKVANNILQAYAREGVDVVVAKNMLSGISGSLNGLSAYIYVLAGILWLLAVIVLVIVFSVSLNERKKEFGIFRVLGAPRSKLVKLLLCESVFISLLGAVTGTAAAALVVFPFSTYMGSLSGLPYLLPPYGAILLAALLSFLISLAVGPLASVYAAVKIGSSETYTTMRENE
jgi:putative ABC transport system permease protein